MRPVSSADLQFLSLQEQYTVLSDYIDMTPTINPRRRFKRLVYLNMSDKLARKDLLFATSNLFNRINSAFDRITHVAEHDYIGITIYLDGYAWFDYDMKGSFHPITGLFELSDKNLYSYKKEYAIEARQNFITQSKNNLTLWLSDDLIKDLKSSEDSKIRISEMVIRQLGEPIPICPKTK